MTQRLLLVAAIAVFAWPDVARAIGMPQAYAPVTIAFAILVVVLTVSSSQTGARTTRIWRPSRLAWPAIVALVALAVAAYRWTLIAAWRPYGADMLIVIREATRRMLSGHSPYTVYRSYDTSWEMAMPYGPMLWGPYLAAQLWHIDLRLVAIVGELTVPAWCGAVAALEAARGRALSAASWLLVATAILSMLDVQGFTLIGHTPVYWPLFPLFAIAIARERWIAAAVVLGLLVAARTTMVAMVPVFVIAVWRADRSRVWLALVAMAAACAITLAPFALANPRSVWDQMVASYPRIMREAVWPVLAKPGLETIGVTEWLIERGRDALIVPVQIGALLAVYAAAWIAIARGRRPLPWMALALFVFSMTTLYTVHYLYYDVLLLFACGAIAEAWPRTDGRLALAWGGTIAAAAILVFACMRLIASPAPDMIVGAASSDRLLRLGFSGVEHDGGRGFAWITGHEAHIALPRSSSADADLVLIGESALPASGPPQRVTALVNGVLAANTDVPAGRTAIRVAVPHRAWWCGFNDVQLVFTSTLSPHDAGAGEDRRPLAMAIDRVTVAPRW